MAIEIAAASAATTAVGTTKGYVAVADTAPFYPGATVYASGEEYMIVDITDEALGLRLKKPKNGSVSYGKTDCSGIASGTVIAQPKQLVPVSVVAPKAVGPQGGR